MVAFCGKLHIGSTSLECSAGRVLNKSAHCTRLPSGSTQTGGTCHISRHTFHIRYVSFQVSWEGGLASRHTQLLSNIDINQVFRGDHLTRRYSDSWASTLSGQELSGPSMAIGRVQYPRMGSSCFEYQLLPSQSMHHPVLATLTSPH